MKKNTILFCLLLIVFIVPLKAQKGEEKLYAQYADEFDKKDYPLALSILDKFIHKYPHSKNLDQIYYNKAIVNIKLNNNDSAITDFTRAYQVNPKFAEAVRLRGNLYYKMNREDDAINDYDLALKIDPKYAEAYANKAYVLKKSSKIAEACSNFESALVYGYTDAVKSIKELCDSNSVALQKYYFRSLDVSTDPDYGLSETKPIKVGKPIQRLKLYLSSLTDEKGNAVEFERTGSCCAYPSNNGFFGMAMCDSYKIKLADGTSKTVFLTFYDYEEPKVPKGFLQKK